jgi:hypothetical protein
MSSVVNRGANWAGANFATHREIPPAAGGGLRSSELPTKTSPTYFVFTLILDYHDQCA